MYSPNCHLALTSRHQAADPGTSPANSTTASSSAAAAYSWYPYSLPCHPSSSRPPYLHK